MQRLLPSLALLAACAGPEGKRERELSNRIVELEQENARLRNVVEAQESRTARMATQHAIVDPPSIDARIVALDPEWKGVYLDKGSHDGVAVGFVFHVYSGATYKGEVRVLRVEDVTSFAEVVREKETIASGDSATTML